MMYPEKFLFTKSHEWVSLTVMGDAYVGISDYAQKELGDLGVCQPSRCGGRREAERVVRPTWNP